MEQASLNSWRNHQVLQLNQLRFEYLSCKDEAVVLLFNFSTRSATLKKAWEYCGATMLLAYRSMRCSLTLRSITQRTRQAASQIGQHVLGQAYPNLVELRYSQASPDGNSVSDSARGLICEYRVDEGEAAAAEIDWTTARAWDK
eukprot:4256531-Amphidinium_carterae.1